MAYNCFFCRHLLASLALLLALALPALAQTAPAPITVILTPGQSPAEIEETLRAAAKAGGPVTVEWRDAANQAAAPASAATPDNTHAATPAVAATPAGTPQQAAPLADPEDSFDTLSARFLNGLQMGLTGISGIAGVMADVAAGIRAEGWSVVSIAAISVLAIAAGLAAAFASRSLIHRLFGASFEVVDLLHRVRASVIRLGFDIAYLVIFAAVAHTIAPLLLTRGTGSAELAHALITIAVVAAVYAVGARFLFAPTRPEIRLLDIAHPRFHANMLATYGAASAVVGASMRFAHQRGLDLSATDGWLLIGVSILTVVKLHWFIGGAGDIRALFTGENPGPVRRAIAFGVPEFYALSAIVLWLMSVIVAGSPNSAAWSFAGGTTQIILLALPILAFGIHSLAGAAAARRRTPASHALHAAISGSIQTALAGATWLIGLHIIIELWRPIMVQDDTAAAVGWIVVLERISLAVVAAWVICSFLWRSFEAFSPSARVAMPGDSEDETMVHQTSRLSTILPLVRNLIFGAIFAVTSLVVLSALGINIAPLLAGFGVLGLALSFGSQTLVKDVVSGIFFIADDAFRVGEYVDTGKLKGTVERISLRSLRLRHQNGQIHTVPYGQLQAVTNFSRDWSTVKFELKFERDADPEKIRKAIKKVGLAMLEDPEIGSEFLVPLKMQGIQDVTENSLVVRLKFTARPGNPSILQREAMKRLLPALREAGLDLASNAVTVRSGAAGAAEAEAAAANLALAKKPVAPEAADAEG
ncbi:mechanosensitive ion channel family protein [Sinorhizobium sp. NFACC03]|uniref:mechanosensitive ion channel family protein n=1 Tax=Sinorhizobium sp. NFACC03 TaxID=1566295 RepID=UPI00088FD8E0|nr:mechanosensitive ion channel family protein [Sinorhizobium sp. NFACC03]SDA92187.1 Small-conductance mechanosensitive channel [Sinorhizobium sp. NFACC03]